MDLHATTTASLASVIATRLIVPPLDVEHRQADTYCRNLRRAGQARHRLASAPTVPAGAAALRQVKAERGWTNAQLACAVGYSKSWIDNVLSGYRPLLMPHARILERRLGLEAGALTQSVRS